MSKDFRLGRKLAGDSSFFWSSDWWLLPTAAEAMPEGVFIRFTRDNTLDKFLGKNSKIALDWQGVVVCGDVYNMLG